MYGIRTLDLCDTGTGLYLLTSQLGVGRPAPSWHAPSYLIDLIAIKEQRRYNLRSARGLILKYPSVKLKRLLNRGSCFFTCCPKFMEQSAPSHSSRGQFFFNLYLKRIFLDWLQIYNVFNLLCNYCIQCFYLIYFQLVYFQPFNIYVLSRAFDHIYMEKARYKFLIIIIINIVIIIMFPCKM